MVEAGQVPRAEWSVDGEHDSDARRAFQIAALAVAADPEKYGPIATEVGLSEDAIQSASDYGTEIHRSWRRLLRKFEMPKGQRSNESRLRVDKQAKLLGDLLNSGLKEDVLDALRRYDWHSTVTIHFKDGTGGASWSRSKRTVTVNAQYLQRFIAQGKSLKR